MDTEITEMSTEPSVKLRVVHPSDFLGLLELEAEEEHLVRRYGNLLHSVESRIPYENIDLERTTLLAHGQPGWFNWAQLCFSLFIASALVTGLVFPATSTAVRALFSLPPLGMALLCTFLSFIKVPYIAFFDGMGNLLFEIPNAPHYKFFYDHLQTKIEIADLTLPAMRIEEEEPLD